MASDQSEATAVVNVMRYTVIDARGTVSFVGKCEALPALVSGCANNSRRLEDLLDAASTVDSSLPEYVSCGLALFDEHNTDVSNRPIQEAIAHLPSHELPVFRVVDDLTRQASLEPVKAGIVIFNLLSKRIVQIQNSYAEIQNMASRLRRLERAGWRVVP